MNGKADPFFFLYITSELHLDGNFSTGLMFSPDTIYHLSGGAEVQWMFKSSCML